MAADANKVDGFSPYQPLKSPETEIRLITILPGVGGDLSDPIECTMKHVDLHNLPTRYHALSYTWGDPDVTVPIKLNGATIQATVNLDAALRHLRSQYYSVDFWIDALCINQRDHREKEKQIPLMASIYSLAGHVVAWLGPEDEHTALAIEHIDSWHAALSKHRLPSTETGDNPINDEFDIALVVDELEDGFDEHRFDAARTVLERPWWTRRWVIQEVFMATDITMLVGTHTLPWKTLARVITGGWGNQLLKHSVPPRYVRMLDGLVRNFNQLDVMRRLKAFGIVQDFLEVAKLTQKTLCGDSRDRIHALLSLTTDGPELISPSYSKTPAEVFTDFAVAHIKRYNHLGILEHSGLAAQDLRAQSPALPSWVAVWGPTTYNITNFHFTFSASGTSNANVTFGPDQTALSASGYVVGTLSHARLFSWEAHVWEPIVFGDEQQPYPTGMSRLQAFFRTILYCVPFDAEDESLLLRRAAGFIVWLGLAAAADPLPDSPELEHYVGMWLTLSQRGGFDYYEWLLSSGRELSTSGDILPTFWEYFLGEGVQWPSDEQGDQRYHLGNFAAEMTACSQGKALARTENGYIGLVPVQAEEGDLVCVLLGCSVPLVLRRVEDHYIVVGSSVFTGLMRGEFMEEADKKGVQLELFELR